MMPVCAKVLNPNRFLALFAAAVMLMALPVGAQTSSAAPAKKAAPPSAAAKLQVQANAQAKAEAKAGANSETQAGGKALTKAVTKSATKSGVTAAPRVQPKQTPGDMASDSPEASADDLAIAQQIHQGLLPCEMGTSIRVEADAAQPGYFHVHGKGFRYRMFPVRTSTGALRLEDKKAGAVWLQLANKSMLMDAKQGRRVADECAHPDQVAFSEKMKTHPLPSLLD
jgi:cytochrome c5